MDVKDIKQLIDTDRTSKLKQDARTGQNYYEGKHDIRNYRIYYYDAEGKLVEDKTKSNIKISHPFFTELVDQQVQYMISGEEFVTSEDQQLEEELQSYFGDRFRNELSTLLTSVVSQGFGYIYAYEAEDGKTRFIGTDGTGVIEVRSSESADNAQYIIRYYNDRVLRDGEYVKIVHAELWDAEKTTYYVSVDNSDFELDPDEPNNPRPHILYRREDDAAEDLYYEDLGYIPFFRLDNNPKRISGLTPIKDIIDDYDSMSCGLSNNLTDLVEGVYVVKNYKGDNLDEMIRNLKTKKHVGVDTDGDVDIRTVDIPYEARVAKLERDEKDIYRFGMGLNTAQVGDGNITNIVIKSRYALLDLKCNKLELRLKAFLRVLIGIALEEINEELGTGYTDDDVAILFERELMTNAKDNADIELVDAQTQAQKVNILLAAAVQLGDAIVAEQIADVLGLDWNEIKDQIPTGDDADAAMAELAAANEQKPLNLKTSESNLLLRIIGNIHKGTISEQQGIQTLAKTLKIDPEKARTLLIGAE